MARLQNALRAYALEGLRPSLVLERMNGFAREVAGGPMATLLYGVIDPEEGRLRLATAGHPPLLVIGPAGDAYFAEGPAGSPLGVIPFPPYEESASRSSPARRSLLYTDGLVERPRAPLDEGLEWLRGLAAGRCPRDPDELCGALLAGALPRRAAARRRRPARRPARAGAGRAHRAHRCARSPSRSRQVRRGVGRWLRARRGDRHRDLRDAGRLRRGVRERDRPRLSARRGLLRGRGPQRTTAQIELGSATSAAGARRGAGSQGRGLALIEELMDEVEIERGARGDDRAHAARDRRPETPWRGMRDRIAGFDVRRSATASLIAVVDGEIDSSNAAELRLALVRAPARARRARWSSTSPRSPTWTAPGIHLLFELGRRLAARRQALRLVVPDALADATRARALRGRRGRPDGHRGRELAARARRDRDLSAAAL